VGRALADAEGLVRTGQDRQESRALACDQPEIARARVRSPKEVMTMYTKLAGAALPTTGVAAHLATGLNYLYAGLIAFAAVGVAFAIKRMLPKRHTS
jgi:hypothetical protein